MAGEREGVADTDAEGVKVVAKRKVVPRRHVFDGVRAGGASAAMCDWIVSLERHPPRNGKHDEYRVRGISRHILWSEVA